MPLQRVDAKIEREADGFAFPMRIADREQTVSVFVSDDALIGLGSVPEDAALRVKIEAERWAFEALASEKFQHERVTGERVLITFNDVKCCPE